MSAGRVAKKIALFELNPSPILLPTPPTASYNATPEEHNAKLNSLLLLHRKDAIKRKKCKSIANSISSSYSEDYGTNSPSSSVYSSGESANNVQLFGDFMGSGSSPEVARVQGQLGGALPEDEIDSFLYHNSSIESDYSNNYSNYNNNDNNRAKAKTLANSIKNEGPVVRTIEIRHGLHGGRATLPNGKSLKDCYQSFSLPMISGQQQRQLKLVEFSEINLNSSEDDLDAGAEDGDDEEEEVRANKGDHLEPFYEELDIYKAELEKGDAELGKYSGSSPSFLWSKSLSKPKSIKKTENDVDSKTINSSQPTPPFGSTTEPESLYSEPVYNEMSSSSMGSSSTYWTPGSSMYNQSHSTATTTTTTTTTEHKSESIYNDLKNCLLRKSQTQSQSRPRPSQGPLNSNSCTSSSSYYDMSCPELPPIPISASSSTKFSTIAKTAGKKLVKKLGYIRRLSKTSLDGFELPSHLSIFNGNSNGPSANNEDISLNGSGSSTSTSGSSRNSKKMRVRSASIGNISCNGISTVPSNYGSEFGTSSPAPALAPVPVLKRSISRPSMPPPPLPLPNPPTQNKPTGLSPDPATAAPANVNGHSELQLPQANEDDDFDDSDFYDSDSELIRNFVAAVQPIYAMEEEPLYQYYTYGISLQPEDDYQPIIPKNLGLTLDMLVPRTGQRTLWCELPEVLSSGILTILSDQQKQLQEAIFEILTSEVSYLKSLDVLITLFYENDQLIQLLTQVERSTLFGNITFVKDCAQTFLTELLTKWEESWYIQDVGQVIHDHANTRFGVYKEYCRNKPYQDKTLQRLRSTNDEFVNVIKSIEEDPKCQLLRMDSFLMLPMQRITRLPLLVNAIIQRAQSPKEKCHCEDALKSLTNLVIECNEAARESQDAEETSAILDKIEFPKGVKSACGNPGQFLLKGDFMRNPFDHQGKGAAKINWTFQKNKRVIYWLILFSNQLLVTKKKSVDKFEVLEMVSPMDANIKPLPNLEGLSKDFQHFFMLHFDRKETVYFLAARSSSEVERWKQKLEQVKNTKELKVEAIFPYEAKRDDELSFDIGETIKVAQMQPDGWYYGTKAGDQNGVSGWFPGNYCAEC